MSLLSLLLESSSLLTCLALLLAWCWWRATRRPPGIPPGPGLALPIIGHMHLLDKDPRPKFREWRRQYGDVFLVYMGNVPVVVLNGLDAIKEALVKNADSFSNRPDAFFFARKIAENKGVGSTSGPLWKEQRKASLEILREMGMGKNVLAEKVQEEVTHYIKALNSHQGKPQDVTRLTHNSVSNNICSIMFGKRFEYDDPVFEDYMETMKIMFLNVQGTSVLNFFPWLEYLPGDLFGLKALLRHVKVIEETFYRQQLMAHKHSFSEGGEASDFTHAYLREIRRQEANGKQTTINEANLNKVMGDLFVAGTDTTATSIRWAIVYFMHNPEVQDRCYKEILRVVGHDRLPSMRDRPELTYVEAMIMEVQRMSNIAPTGVPHGLSKEAKLRGYTIPQDAMVLTFLESTLFDPDVWESPMTFNPDRFIGPDGKLIRREELIPFSVGRRACLGESLARMELFLYLTAMIQHFRFLPPEGAQPPSYTDEILGITRSPAPFKVRAVSRV